MQEIKKRYVVDEGGKRVAVQVDLETFEQIEEVLENYALVQLMQQNDTENPLDSARALAYYRTLPKAP
ncbi:hypothetical protein BH24GEM3_BH24GEM3_01530 [soil metagenome]|jgi:hypothetical protein